MDQVPTDGHLRRRYAALLRGETVIGKEKQVIETEFARWRELKRLVIVYGLPRDESITKPAPAINEAGEAETDQQRADTDGCSLRGRIWKAFLGVPMNIDSKEYTQLIERGASHYDSDIRNDTFRTFRGDPEFAHRVPEEKLARLLNVFINEQGSKTPDAAQSTQANPETIRYVQGMNILCAPLLYVMPEADAYHTFCRLIVNHCPQYMAPQLKGVENGCILVDKCLQTLDPELFRHLSSRGITARIYALPLILSLFACVPPLQELLRVWDVLFAVGVHFVVILAVAHTVLLREQLLEKDMDLMKILSLRFAPPLQSDQLISVALQLMHRLPEELLYEIARHPFENPDHPSCLPFSAKTVHEIMQQARSNQAQSKQDKIPPHVSSSTTSSPRSSPRSAAGRPATAASGASGSRPPWKL